MCLIFARQGNTRRERRGACGRVNLSALPDGMKVCNFVEKLLQTLQLSFHEQRFTLQRSHRLSQQHEFRGCHS
jgi:hypothetical protein